MSTVIPCSITLHKQSQVLELIYSDGAFTLSAEFLRVYSPSAEVKGHGPSQAVLQLGKEAVNILQIVPQGRYAVKIVFDDGHDSGIYTWPYLFELSHKRESLWSEYLLRVKEHQESAEISTVTWVDNTP